MMRVVEDKIVHGESSWPISQDLRGLGWSVGEKGPLLYLWGSESYYFDHMVGRDTGFYFIGDERLGVVDPRTESVVMAIDRGDVFREIANMTQEVEAWVGFLSEVVPSCQCEDVHIESTRMKNSAWLFPR